MPSSSKELLDPLPSNGPIRGRREAVTPESDSSFAGRSCDRAVSGMGIAQDLWVFPSLGGCFG